MEIKDKIKNRRLELGLTLLDVAKSVGVSEATVSRWESGDIANMKRDKIALLSQALKLSPIVIMGLDERPERIKGTKIPVLGKVAAGIPIDAVQDILDYEEISEQLASTGEFFALQVKGDSMEPRICEGDVLIVRQQSNAESGETVIALINGDEATCKKLVKHTDGISLVPLNTKYEPMFFSNAEIMQKPVSIIGKVIENRQKY